MKKIFAAILAVFMIFAGLSIRGREDRLEPMERSESGGCVRVDTLLSAETVISRLAARELWREEVCGVTIYYAYSDFVRGYEIVHRKRVNVMIAEREEVTAVGMPLLTGSY